MTKSCLATEQVKVQPQNCLSFSDGSSLKHVTSVEYFGLWVDPELSFQIELSWTE